MIIRVSIKLILKVGGRVVMQLYNKLLITTKPVQNFSYEFMLETYELPQLAKSALQTDLINTFI